MSFLAKRILETAASLALVVAADAADLLGDRVLASDAPGRAARLPLQGANAISDRTIAGWVDKRVQEWQITPAERRFDEIGWAKTLGEAERLAKQHGRPVFLFTHDGRMAIGRC
jgi:hypothetical protein